MYPKHNNTSEETKVLVIDDEQTYLDLITDTLKEKKYKILQALNGEMGYMVAQKFIPDIIITDWEMPELNGVETIRRLKSNPVTKDIPVIMCTGIMTSSENLETSLNVGAVDYIRKPVDPLELVARINSALNLSKSLKEIKRQNEKLIQKSDEISKQNEKLQNLNATKDKLFSIIGHDLRNPFNNIIGMSEVLVNYSENFDKEKIIESVNSILRSANNAFKLLSNLLEWAMSQTGKIDYKPKDIPIKELVLNSIEILSGNSQSKEINVEFTSKENIYVFADKNMINTVLGNLITNAVKYTPRGGNITITTVKNDDFAEISVSDNGIGISPDKFESLFKISETKSTLGTEKEKGTGLGLMLCKDFIERNNGQIGAKSNPENGATFWFTIPLSKFI